LLHVWGGQRKAHHGKRRQYEQRPQGVLGNHKNEYTGDETQGRETAGDYGIFAEAKHGNDADNG
jgi:hypothetical protein